MPKEDGFTLQPRKFWYDELWTKRRKFSQAEAWLDLCQLAQYEDKPELPAWDRIELKRGQVLTSLHGLSERWCRSKTWIKTFLKYLQKRESIKYEITRRYIVVTICKYDQYQSLEYYMNGNKAREKNGEKTEKKRKSPHTSKDTTVSKELIYKVFEFWNEQKMHHHLKFTEEIEKHIRARINDYGIELVIEAIKNYSRILHGDNFKLTYKWTLVDFTKSVDRFEKFLTYNRPYHRYLNTKKMSEAQLEAALQEYQGRTRSSYDNQQPEDVRSLVAKSLKQAEGK